MQLDATDATINEMRRQVATRDQLEELRELVEKMRKTGDSTHVELKQLHAEIRALASALLHHRTESSYESEQRSITMGQLGTQVTSLRCS